MSGSYAYGGNPPGIELAYHYGGGGLGVLGSVVPSAGDDGTPYMYESVIARPGYADKEYIGYIDPAAVPTGLTLFPYEDASFTASGPNGSYPVPWVFREIGTRIGEAPFTVNIGVVRRALIFRGVKRGRITDVEIGTGLKPLVLHNGRIKRRAASEGVPVVFMNGRLRVLASGEILQV